MNNTIPIYLIGISHKTAPVEVREPAALDSSEQERVIRTLIPEFDLDGCMIISTCNRTEVYVSGYLSEESQKQIRRRLNQLKNTDLFENDDFIYIYSGERAVAHFFQVISGLDSQIIGEPQITGQVKDGYQLAHDLKSTGALLNKLLEFGLQTEKRIRNETFLSDGAVSVSFAGVELARKIFTDLTGKHVLLIGAGETAELAALHFLDKGVTKIRIANRTLQKAEALAEKFRGSAHTLEELPQVLQTSDIVISATSSSDYLVTREMMKKIGYERRSQPIILIDLAIPRDIEPSVQKIENVYLYNLDALQEIVRLNLKKREKEIPAALEIVDEMVSEYESWCKVHSLGSFIEQLTHYFDTLRQNELARLNSRLPEEGREEVEYLTQSILNKILHQHISFLKQSTLTSGDHAREMEMIRKIYGMDGD